MPRRTGNSPRLSWSAHLRLLAVKTLDEARLPTPPERGSQVVDLGFGLLDKLLIITVCRCVALSSERRVVVAVRVRAVSASPDSPSFSSAYWRTVSSNR
jgi:hypothetical protein